MWAQNCFVKISFHYFQSFWVVINFYVWLIYQIENSFNWYDVRNHCLLNNKTLLFTKVIVNSLIDWVLNNNKWFNIVDTSCVVKSNKKSLKSWIIDNKNRFSSESEKVLKWKHFYPFIDLLIDGWAEDKLIFCSEIWEEIKIIVWRVVHISGWVTAITLVCNWFDLFFAEFMIFSMKKWGTSL